jgi:hypothetical protein
MGCFAASGYVGASSKMCISTIIGRSTSELVDDFLHRPRCHRGRGAGYPALRYPTIGRAKETVRVDREAVRLD